MMIASAPIGVRPVDDELGMDLDEDEGSIEDSVEEVERSVVDSDSAQSDSVHPEDIDDWQIPADDSDDTMNSSSPQLGNDQTD